MRICLNCGKYMRSGYVVSGNTCCSDECLIAKFPEFEKGIDEVDDEVFWTEWELGDFDEDTLEEIVQEFNEHIKENGHHSSRNLVSLALECVDKETFAMEDIEKVVNDILKFLPILYKNQKGA